LLNIIKTKKQPEQLKLVGTCFHWCNSPERYAFERKCRKKHKQYGNGQVVSRVCL